MSRQLALSGGRAARPAEFGLKNRRYIGSKSRLLPFIAGKIRENCGEFGSICDAFAGTGSVGQAFNDGRTRVASNDHLASNYFPLCTFLLYDDSLADAVRGRIAELNSLEPGGNNYFSRRYGGTFFTHDNARRIGAIRDAIREAARGDAEERILTTSLMYAMDRLANTVGHYDAYRKAMDRTGPVKLGMPRLEGRSTNRGNTVTNADANEAVKGVRADVLYLDPPYNSRQYCDAYHLLENVARWEKAETFGKAEKIDRGGMKSRYCTKDAEEALGDLVSDSRSEHIFLSYNSTGESRDGRSNAKIGDGAIRRILGEKGRLEVFESAHPEFTAGRNRPHPGHAERLFYCRARR